MALCHPDAGASPIQRLPAGHVSETTLSNSQDNRGLSLARITQQVAGGGAVRQASHPLTQERATVEPLGLGPFSQAPTTAILLACRRGRSPRAKDSA